MSTYAGWLSKALGNEADFVAKAWLDEIKQILQKNKQAKKGERK